MTCDTVYNSLAALLDYPSGPAQASLGKCQDMVRSLQPEAAALLEQFGTKTKSLTLGEMQELYTRTFDYNPATALEVGWHMFGENYDRGAFLVRMREELRKHGLPESTELPDHLTHVLAALGCMDDTVAREFAATYVIPSLEPMCTGVGKLESPYEHVLAAIRLVLIAHYGPANPYRLPLNVHQQHEDLLESEGR